MADTYPRIRVVIKRKPPPPPLEPFECLACREMIERDPFSPDFNAPPVCWRCQWSEGGRTQLSSLPFSAWGHFRTAQVLLNCIKKEAVNVRNH